MLNGLEVARKFNMRIKPIDEFSLQILKAKQSLFQTIIQMNIKFKIQKLMNDKMILHYILYSPDFYMN